MIISSTTFMYVVFSNNSWILHLEGLNQVEPWAAGLIALATFIIVSFAKIYLGQNYPSDCLLSLPPIILIIALYYLVCIVDKAIDLCPSCMDKNGNDSLCYYDSEEITAENPILMNRANFSIGVSNSLSTTIIALVWFAIFTVVSSEPIEFWKKIPYFIPTLLSIYLFKNIMLCPCAENDFRSINSPMQINSVA